ncbi:MAG: hypothetical protein G01um101430_786 [Parcubacteria group bacterium Gr01-1014_30]|nr:MAG: hypothetical protein G01um101430_786 [Parcubacteria group bacterium Gr01-1014_30]
MENRGRQTMANMVAWAAFLFCCWMAILAYWLYIRNVTYVAVVWVLPGIGIMATLADLNFRRRRLWLWLLTAVIALVGLAILLVEVRG